MIFASGENRGPATGRQPVTIDRTEDPSSTENELEDDLEDDRQNDLSKDRANPVWTRPRAISCKIYARKMFGRMKKTLDNRIPDS